MQFQPPLLTDWGTDIYTRAVAIGLVQKDVEELVPLVLARAGYELRKIQGGTAGEYFPLSLFDVPCFPALGKLAIYIL